MSLRDPQDYKAAAEVEAGIADSAIRAFNRLEAAITHHRKAHTAGGGVLFTEDADLALWKVRDKILADWHSGAA